MNTTRNIGIAVASSAIGLAIGWLAPPAARCTSLSCPTMHVSTAASPVFAISATALVVAAILHESIRPWTTPMLVGLWAFVVGWSVISFETLPAPSPALVVSLLATIGLMSLWKWPRRARLANAILGGVLLTAGLFAIAAAR